MAEPLLPLPAKMTTAKHDIRIELLANVLQAHYVRGRLLSFGFLPMAVL